METSPFEESIDAQSVAVEKEIAAGGLERVFHRVYIGRAWLPGSSSIEPRSKVEAPNAITETSERKSRTRGRRVHQPTGKVPGRPKSRFRLEVDRLQAEGMKLGKELHHAARRAAIECGEDVSGSNGEKLRVKVRRIYRQNSKAKLRRGEGEKKQNT